MYYIKKEGKEVEYRSYGNKMLRDRRTAIVITRMGMLYDTLTKKVNMIYITLRQEDTQNGNY